MGRRGRRLHPPGTRRGYRKGRTDRLHARLARPAQDAKTLVHRGRVPADRIGQDPEIQAARSLDQGRDGGDLKTTVLPSGCAAIKRLLIDGKPVYEEPWF